jgi:PKD repeat protein
MKKLISTLLVCLSFFAYTGLQGQPCNAPIINSFSPNTGFIGSTVTIIGANFSTTPSSNQVFFGATQATVLTSSFGVLTVTVPVGATTSPISVKNHCNLTAYSPISFNGIFCPTPLTSTTYQNVAFNLTGIVGAYNMLSQDMDGDGKPDIVSEGFGSNFTIARNTSTPGVMSFANNFVSSPGPRSVAVADFDGDGRRDLLSNGYVHRNLSSPGTVLMSSAQFIGNTGYQCAAGDVNNDGKIDAISGSGNIIIICLNTSTGPGVISFTTPTSTINSGGNATGLQMADIDGDGKVDILGTHGSNNRGFSLRNITVTGSNTPQFEPVEFWPSNGSFPYRCQIADFDKDGKIDLTTCNFSGTANTAVLRNTSTPGNISFANAFTMPAPGSNYRIAVGDVNGDGLPDIVTKSSGANIFSVYPNTSTGAGVIAFGTRIDYTSSAQAEVSGIVIGDLDGDFVPDIATSGSSSNAIRVHRNTSSQVDNTAPNAICKNITVALSPTGTASVTAAMIDNGSGDACGIGSLQINNSASVTFTCANIGANNVTLTVTDRAGNTSTCTAVVTVAPAAIIVAGQTTVCQGQTVPLTANVGDSYQWQKDGVDISGATAQTYTATESGNYTVTVTNAGGCSGTSAPTAITVNNNPTVSTTPSGNASLCPPNGNVVLSASTSSIYQWKFNGNNISGATQQNYTANQVGTYTVQVIDLFGCSATSAPIVVGATDNVPPVAICRNVTVALDANGNGSINTNSINNGSFDNCGIRSITLTGQTVFTCADAGQTFTVTMNVLDNNNNTSSCTATVTVTDPLSVCNQPPVAVCQPVVLNADANCSATATAEAFNNGSSDANGDALTYSVSPAGPYAVGVTPVVLTVTDSKGASSTCATTVTVNDVTPPVLVGVPADATVECDAVPAAATVAATDNCTTSAVSLTETITPGACANSYTITRTWSTTDASNNTTTASQTITVQDTQAPTLSAAPADVTVECDAVPAAATLTAGDNCDNAPVVTFAETRTNGNCPSNYTLTRVWTATDACGNASSKTQVITVQDTQAPTLSAAPADETVECDAVPAAATLTAGDNCDNAPVVTFAESRVNGNCPGRYTLTRTWTATDACGNASSKTQTIIVQDTQAPTANCKPVTVTLVNGTATITAAAVNNNSADNCGAVTLSVSKTTFNCNNLGANTVTLTVTDECGNSSTCDAVVTVVGEIPTCSIASVPTSNVFTGGVSTNLYLGYGAQSTTLQVSAPASGAPYSYSWTGTGLSNNNTANPVFTPTTAGNYSFTVLVTNKYGCTTTCSITICVRDIRVPGTSGKKVYVCHIPPGNPANAQTLSISVNAVPAHVGLHGGDRLGTCDMQPCGVAPRFVNTTDHAEHTESGITLKASPNPSSKYFLINIASDDAKTPVTVRIMTGTGKVVEVDRNIAPGSTIQVGDNFKPGTYFFEAVQGGNRKVMQLIKLK